MKPVDPSAILNGAPEEVSEVVKVPSPEEAKKQFSEFNKDYIKTIRSSVALEAVQYRHMLEQQGSQSRRIEDDLEDIAVLMLESARNRIEKSFGGIGRVDSILSMYMRYLNAIFSGQSLTPIYGTDNEWEDVTNPEDAKNGATFQARVNGQLVKIPFTKIEVNKRMRTIFRLNGDNRYAHRTDFIALVDPAKPDETHLNDESIRFIKFPYQAESLTCHCTFKDGKVDEYLSCTEDYIKNGIVFPSPDADMRNPETYHHYMICPKIPEHMFEEFGIDKDAAVEQYLKEVEEEHKAMLSRMQAMSIADTGEAPLDPETDGTVDTEALPSEDEDD